MMYLVVSGFSHVLAVVGLDGRTREEIIGLHHEVHARLIELEARVEALRIFGSTLAVFWGPSYTDLNSILREGCDHHLSDLQQLRAELDRELEALDDLGRRKLQGAAARLMAIAAEANDLHQSIRGRERFWEQEAHWTLDLLGARTASIWPPEPNQPPPAQAASAGRRCR